MFEQAFQSVKEFVAAKNTAGAVAQIGWRGQNFGPRAYGSLSFFPGAQPLAKDTIFDLASLSKVVATTTITLKLMEEGLLRLTDTVGELVGRQAAHKQEITIQQLLTHTSGLPAVFPLYKEPGFKDRDRALATVLKVPLRHKIGQKVEYSCVGFILLGLLLEKISATPLDHLFTTLVAQPLGLKDTMYHLPPQKIKRVAVTEWDWAEKAFLQGVVHDENARSLHGISGNAGLFGTASDLGVFAQMLLQRGSHQNRQFLKERTIDLLSVNLTKDPLQPRSLGWLLPSPQACSASQHISQKSIGHTGFTGTSLWLDFKRHFYGVLLTNRVHPSRQNQAIIQLRPQYYKAICLAIDGANSLPI